MLQPTRRKKLMKILLAGPRGFCAGVNMAIETLETAIRLYGTFTCFMKLYTTSMWLTAL